MNIKENKNFQEVKLYSEKIELDKILELNKTEHMKKDRQIRLNTAISLLDKDDYIEHVFLVDKNHPEGKELHCVTHSGIIFILNERKYLKGVPCLITIFLARRNQIIRLYEPFNLKVSKYTLNKCEYYITNHLNI